jgi:hypothetical protein
MKAMDHLTTADRAAIIMTAVVTLSTLAGVLLEALWHFLFHSENGHDE